MRGVDIYGLQLVEQHKQRLVYGQLGEMLKREMYNEGENASVVEATTTCTNDVCSCFLHGSLNTSGLTLTGALRRTGAGGG